VKFEVIRAVGINTAVFGDVASYSLVMGYSVSEHKYVCSFQLSRVELRLAEPLPVKKQKVTIYFSPF
jgi:hypothetical protein